MNSELGLHRHGRSRRNRFHNLRRQSKAHIFRHDFQFLHVAEALPRQLCHHFLHQMLRSRCSRGQGHRLHAIQPLRLNVAAVID